MPEINETTEPVTATPLAVVPPPQPAEATPAVEAAPANDGDVEEKVVQQIEHQFLLDDISAAVERARRTKSLGEAKAEFADQAYPLMQAVVEHFGERMARTEAALAEMIDQTDSFVQPDLAMEIANALNMGKALATIVLQFKAGMVVEAKGLAKMHGLAQQFLAAAEQAAEHVASVTLEPGDDDDEDDEDGDEDEEKS